MQTITRTYVASPEVPRALASLPRELKVTLREGTTSGLLVRCTRAR